MNVDIRKCIDASLLPAAAILIIGVVLQLAGSFMPSIADLVALPALIADLVLLGWAGYRVVKEQAMDFIGGTVTGAFAGAIASFAGAIISLVFVALGIGVNAGALSATAAYGTAIVVAAILIGLVISIVFGILEGTVFGAIGAYFAGMRK